MLRSIAERLSRGRRLKRRLPKRYGHTPFYVSPDAQLKYLKLGEDAFDAELLKIVDKHIHEASSVWDIGANVGVFSFASASVAKKGSVLAVEADSWLANLIRSSIGLKSNHKLNMQVLPCAISSDNGVATFMIARRGRASNALEIAGGRSQSGGFRQSYLVPTLTLDTLLEYFDAPNFVKIDVEGAEALVLNGAQRLLAQVRPIIYIEVGEVVNQEVTTILLDSGYSIFDGSKPITEQSPRSSCAFNTIAFPAEALAHRK